MATAKQLIESAISEAAPGRRSLKGWPLRMSWDFIEEYVKSMGGRSLQTRHTRADTRLVRLYSFETPHRAAKVAAILQGHHVDAQYAGRGEIRVRSGTSWENFGSRFESLIRGPALKHTRSDLHLLPKDLQKLIKSNQLVRYLSDVIYHGTGCEVIFLNFRVAGKFADVAEDLGYDVEYDGGTHVPIRW